jgi:hypothetical protein
MIRASHTRVLAGCVVLLAVALILVWSSQPVLGQRGAPQPKGGPGSHYTVVMTEGHNLLVTDNGANKLYFYTVDKDKPIGSPLKLRAEVDLTKVGQEEIKITAHNLEKVDKEPAK